MNLKTMTDTELRILLIACPYFTQQYKDVCAEIKRREAALRWKQANDSQIWDRLNSALKVHQN